MKKKIIIVENNKEAFEKLRRNVNGIGEVVTTYDEVTAVLQSKDQTISDLIQRKMDEYGKEIVSFIIDLQLSGDSAYGGIQLIRDIRGRASSLGKDEYWRTIVPIIVCTNYPNFTADAKEAGANRVIEKLALLEKEDAIIDAKQTWKKGLSLFLTQTFLPIITSYSEWYCSARKKIEETPESFRKAAYRFFQQNNDPSLKYAFVMTSFTDAYKDTISQSLSALEEEYYVKPILANHPYGETNEELFTNIKGMMHSCDFGIGVFFLEPKTNSINPNLSLEVGYMLGLDKQICYLKDKNLPKLNTDLAAMIYTEYKKTKNAKGKGVKLMKDALLEWVNGNAKNLNIRKR